MTEVDETLPEDGDPEEVLAEGPTPGSTARDGVPAHGTAPTDPAPVDTGPARRSWRVRIGLFLLVASVAATVVLLVVRMTALQELHALLVGIAGVTDLAMFGVVPVAVIGALLARGPGGLPVRWSAPVVCIPLVAALQFSWPSLIGLVAPEDATSGKPLTIAAQNLWRLNPDPEGAARTVLDTGADVLVLSEFTPMHARAFQELGAHESYPHRVTRLRSDSQGMVVMSRFPLVPARRQPRLFRLVTDVRPPGAESLTLVATHLPAPNRPGQLPDWKRELRAVTADAGAAGGSVVVAGDFNSGDGHRLFREMAREAGLRSTQDHGGGGISPTWPMAGRGVPPLMRLDHILVGEDVGVEGFEFLPKVGADHRGTFARLRLQPS